MEDDSLPFATDALSYAEKKPKFVPASVDVQEFRIDFNAFTILKEFETLLKPILTGIDDTKTLCGAETYKSARSVYKTIKQAAAEGVNSLISSYTTLFRPEFYLKSGFLINSPYA